MKGVVISTWRASAFEKFEVPSRRASLSLSLSLLFCCFSLSLYLYAALSPASLSLSLERHFIEHMSSGRGHCPSIGNQPAPYRGLLGPPGPKCRKSLENVSQGLRPRDPKKSQKKSRGQSGKSPESLRKVSGECFWSVPGLFGDFLGSRGLRPRETFSRLFRHFGPGGPKRPL